MPSPTASGCSLEVDVDAAVVAAEHVDVAHPDLGVGGHADVLGHEHARLAHAQVELERHVAGGQVGLAQVDAPARRCPSS